MAHMLLRTLTVYSSRAKRHRIMKKKDLRNLMFSSLNGNPVDT